MTNSKLSRFFTMIRFLVAALLVPFGFTLSAAEKPGDWVRWRGPLQSGVSLEHYKKPVFEPKAVWEVELAGRGTPVIHDGRLYAWGYRGQGPDLQEVLMATDAATGKVLWERSFNDFISDTVYDRYSVGAPVVDPETGNIYLHTTYGIFNCHDRDGNLLWEISMMERFGRLTFPNGRAGACVIDGDLVITRAVTAYWGADGPARDRFFAFDKKTGDLVWASSPGVGDPYLKDTSFSTPYLTTRNGRRVMYVGLGCGNLAALNVADGKPLWRFQVTVGGLNASPVIHHGDKVICIHGTENVDSTETGRMVALKLPADDAKAGGEVEEGQGGAPKISNEWWRNNLEMFGSSPVIVGDRLYQVTMNGELHSVDASNGKILWTTKLGTDQILASPLYADGLLYITMNQGLLYVIKPTDAGPETLHRIELEGNCHGSPSLSNGILYVHTMQKLYAFRIRNEGISYDSVPAEEAVVAGAPASIRVVPSDVLMEPGDKLALHLSKVDANGNVLGSAGVAKWESFIPPTAKVKAVLDAKVEGTEIAAGPGAKQSAGIFKGTEDGISGMVRGRVVAPLPFTEDFEKYQLSVDHPVDGVKFAYPPLPWIGARLKWEVREVNGSKVLAKTLDNILFMRSLSFFGHPDSSNYTMQADVMTDGNRRIKSSVGLINQRYNLSLVGNSNLLEISSNHERVKHSVPFPVTANQWYTLKLRVDVNPDGSGVVRGKAWGRESAEPDAWTIEFTHKNAHKKGAPGIFGFSPQSQKSVYIDNIKATPNR
ncbi:MAG: Outer membrane protein assembly factor BamB, contains PQQ-like beta-propeller repeat [Verrucomicrobia bacterium]|nr:MAG: Outer membrane protein assembly factor BamB, contains PQQ-like beta-propeller repeat [Verrucomicrobiota bacterium]